MVQKISRFLPFAALIIGKLFIYWLIGIVYIYVDYIYYIIICKIRVSAVLNKSYQIKTKICKVFCENLGQGNCFAKNKDDDVL